MQALVNVPTAADFPAAQFVQAAPGKEILPTPQLMQSPTTVPAPATTDLPAAQSLQPVAVAVPATTHFPTAQMEQGEPDAEVFPATQSMQVSMAPTPPTVWTLPAKQALTRESSSEVHVYVAPVMAPVTGLQGLQMSPSR